MLAPIVLSPAAYAWQTGAPAPTPCLAVGQMSGLDIAEGTITLKSDSGRYSDIHYDRSTIFSDGKAMLPPLDLNVDDRVCVQAFADRPGGVTSHVLIVRRSSIDARDKADLLAWERDSVFGTVTSLDTGNRRLTLRTAGGSEVRVDAAGQVALWTLPAGAIDAVDAVPGDWKQITSGDALYVRGDRDARTGMVRARLVVAGGFRSFAGSIESMEPLTSQLRLRGFRSGRSRDVHFDFMPIYIVGMADRSGGRTLYQANVGDLDVGDSVLVLAKQDRQTGNIDALLLVTGFSRDAILRPQPGQSPDWIFNSVGLGGQQGASR